MLGCTSLHVRGNGRWKGRDGARERGTIREEALVKRQGEKEELLMVDEIHTH